MKKIGVVVLVLIFLLAVWTGSNHITKNEVSIEYLVKGAQIERMDSEVSNQMSSILDIHTFIDPIHHSYPTYKKGELIVKFKKGFSPKIRTMDTFITFGLKHLDNLNKVYRVNNFEKLIDLPSGDICKLKFSEDIDPVKLAEEYEKSPYVEYAEPNYIYRVFSVPNDPLFHLQWSLNQSTDHDIDAPDAWNLTTGRGDIVIAVIDTGVNYSHPDLAGNIWINEDETPGNSTDDDGNGYVDDYYGWDFVNDDNEPLDDYGHGTHCAGIIGAVGNNSIGISGVCWNCSIMPVKCFDEGGSGYLDDLIDGIHYAADNGADIISMSWGSIMYSSALEDALNYAYSKGCLLIAAAGNNNTYVKMYPAAYNNVIAVSATDEFDEKANFSNYGYWVDVSAPGTNILSTLPDGTYGNDSGTSMACPHVAGIAGLILSKDAGLNQSQVSTILKSAVDPVNSAKYVGTGRVNAYQAVSIGFGVAKITYPSSGTSVGKGIINITGDASANYSLLYGEGLYPENWTYIGNFSGPIWNETLGTWDTSSLENGTYTLRLIVNGSLLDEVVIRVGRLILHVGGTGEGNYTSIQDAVEDAFDGDTIIIHNNTYSESILIAYKNITVKGESDTGVIIAPSGNASLDIIICGVILFRANSTIENLSIRDSLLAAVYTLYSACTIENLRMENNSIGILSVGESVVIRGNTINNSYEGMWLAVRNSTIVDNIISNSTIGLDLFSIIDDPLLNDNPNQNNSIQGNEITNNTIAILVMDSLYANIEGNDISSNGYGIYAPFTDDVEGECSGTCSFNFETNKEETDSPYTDFWWEQVNDTVRYLVPKNGAEFAIVEESYENITYDNAICEDFSDEKINGSDDNNSIPPGTVLICHTAEGNYLKMRIDACGYNLQFTYAFLYPYNITALMNSTVSSNIIIDNFYGVVLANGSNNTIYNNYMDNEINAIDNEYNTWNISKTLGRNIVGGPYLGGNYWSDYSGVDTDGDGLGNTKLPYNSSGNITSGGDSNPLVVRVYNINQDRWYYSIQYAINNADDGDTVKAYPGVYRENIVISKPLRLVGDPVIDAHGGIGISIERNDTFVENFTVYNFSTAGVYAHNISFTIKNVTINNFTIYNSDKEKGIYLYSVTQSTISNCQVNDTFDAIYIEHSSCNTITNNTIFSNDASGIFLYSSSTGNTIFNNTIIDNRDGIYLDCSANYNTIKQSTIENNNRYGIYSTYSSNTFIEGCSISSNHECGIYLRWGSSNNKVSNCTLYNQNCSIRLETDSNNIYNTTICNTNMSTNVYGIYITGSQNVIDNVTICNLTAYNLSASSSAYGVFLKSVSNKVKFSRIYNLSIDNNNTNDGSYGIYLYSAGNAEILSNTIYNTRVGIYIMGVSSYNNISLNRIHDARWGIHLYGSNANSNNIDNNTIYNVSGLTESSAIYVYPGAQFNTITNNMLYNSTRGVYLWNNANNNTIVSNTIYRNGRGIEIRGSSYNTISYNTIHDNNEYGIYILGYVGTESTNNNIINNTIYNHTGTNHIGIYIKSGPNNVTQNRIYNNWRGINIESVDYNNVTFNTIYLNGGEGIWIGYCSHNNITGNSIYSNSYGIYSEMVDNSTFTLNNLTSNTHYGLYLISSTDNLIYNNYFNNTDNAYDDGTNTWNISKTPGRNIVGGPYLGGNYWSDYSGVDTDGDKLGDTSLPYNSSGNIASGGDFLPLIINNPPTTPYAPSPSNGSTGVSITTDLSWQCSDPDGDNVTYDVYFGTSNPPPKVSGNQTSTTYDPGTLSYSKTYYWRIVAWDETGLKTIGPLWHFTTRSSGGGGSSVPSNRPPVADANGPYHGFVSSIITFDASSSYDPDGTIVNYTWNLGDGTIKYGVKITHVYLSPGNYTIILTVTDDKGAHSNDQTFALIEEIPGDPPVAVIKAPSEVIQYEQVIFDASSSYDPDGTIVNYTWNLGDGTIKYGVKITHVYLSPGNYTVTLTVVDNDGLTNHTSRQIGVRPDADKDGWSDDEEELYGTDPNNASSCPMDTDDDGLPDTVDPDDDNDGLIDTLEQEIGSPQDSANEYAEPVIDGKTTYLVDTDNDSIYDIFYDPETGTKTSVEQNKEGKYLIDSDGDGEWDYIYDPVAGSIIPKEEEIPPSYEPSTITLLIVAAILIVAFVGIVFYLKRKS